MYDNEEYLACTIQVSEPCILLKQYQRTPESCFDESHKQSPWSKPASPLTFELTVGNAYSGQPAEPNPSQTFFDPLKLHPHQNHINKTTTPLSPSHTHIHTHTHTSHGHLRTHGRHGRSRRPRPSSPSPHRRQNERRLCPAQHRSLAREFHPKNPPRRDPYRSHRPSRSAGEYIRDTR